MRNKNNIRKNADNYSSWLDKHEGYDMVSAEGWGDVVSPFYVRPLSSALEDVYERLENLYFGDKLKGRQKQIVSLLLEGETNQMTIAKRLNMKQSNVSVELQKIREKLTKNII